MDARGTVRMGAMGPQRPQNPCSLTLNEGIKQRICMPELSLRATIVMKAGPP